VQKIRITHTGTSTRIIVIAGLRLATAVATAALSSCLLLFLK